MGYLICKNPLCNSEIFYEQEIYKLKNSNNVLVKEYQYTDIICKACGSIFESRDKRKNHISAHKIYM